MISILGYKYYTETALMPASALSKTPDKRRRIIIVRRHKAQDSGTRAELPVIAGEAFVGASWSLTGLFSLRYLTDGVGISAHISGIIAALAMLWSLGADIMLRSAIRSRRGNMLSGTYIMAAGALLIPISFLLLALPAEMSSSTAQTVTALLAFLLYSSAYSMVTTPYLPFGRSMHTGGLTQTFFVNGRHVVRALSAMFTAVFAWRILSGFQNAHGNLQLPAILIGALLALPFLVIAVLPQNKGYSRIPGSRVRMRSLFEPFRVKSFRLFAGILVCISLIHMLTSSVFTYYVQCSQGRPDNVELALGALALGTVLAAALSAPLASKLDKPETLAAFLLIWLAGIFALSRINSQWPSWAVGGAAALAGFGSGGTISLPNLMYRDLVRVFSLTAQKRIPRGLTVLIRTLRRISRAGAVLAAGLTLHLSGYQTAQSGANVISPATGAIAQPYNAIGAIQALMIVMPIVILGMLYFLIRKYPLNRDKLSRLSAIIQNEKNGPSHDESTEVEKERLRRELL